MHTRLHTLLVGAACVLLPVSAQASLSFLGGVELVGGGEIVSYDAASGSLLTTVSQGTSHQVGIYSLNTSGVGSVLGNYRTVELSTTFGVDGGSTFSLSSVAADPLGRGFGVASLIPTDRLTTVGKIAFFDIGTGSVLNTLDAGYHPDSVSFTPDGSRLLVANEGEFVDTTGTQTAGSVSIVNLAGLGLGDISGLNGSSVTDVNFSTGLASGVTLAGVRNARLDTLTVKSPDALDVEPEYVSATNDRAYVSLQEGNAIAVIDLHGANANQVTAIHTLGTITMTTDASDRGETTLNDTIKGLPMPDTISTFERGGKTYVVTANEGDARPDDGDIKRLSSSPLDTTDDGNGDVVASVQTGNDGLSRANLIQDLGDVDGDGLIEDPVMFGARSFSIVDGTTGEIVFDSGNMIEAYVQANDPALFNINKEQGTVQARSDDKGPEVEAVAVGSIDGRDFVFAGAERQNGIFMFDITDLENVFIVDYINLSEGSTFEAAGVDYVSPESLQFLTIGGEHFLVAGYEGEGAEFDGSIAVFQVSLAAIPEPASVAALAGIGALGLAVSRRRRRA